jgi:Abnormal spindle-like microcephaly-assoc'd, ASPM-SPD-2-Hydin
MHRLVPGVTEGPCQSGGTAVTMIPINLTFAAQAVGTTSVPKAVTLTNVGTTALSVSSVVATGDFAETDNCVGTVAAGSGCTLTVTFTPSATGVRTGTVTITDSDGATPQKVQVKGTGQ